MSCLFFYSKYSTLFRRTKEKKRKFIPKPGMVYEFWLPFFNNIALLAHEDASLLKQSLLLYLQKCSMYFSTKLLLLDVIALTLLWKPGETLFTFCAVFTCNYLPLSTRLTKLLRFKLNQITSLGEPGLPCFWGGRFFSGLRGNPGQIRLTMLLRKGILTRPTRKLWLNQANNAFKVKNLNHIYQKTLISTRPTTKAW